MSAPRLRIGIDLDNTLVCYDEVFARRAAALGPACPPNVAAKRAVRDALRRTPGGEIEWTLCQGDAYGPGLAEAQPFPGARETIVGWLRAGHSVVIVSHKSRFPALGPAHDFHALARAWLARWLGDLDLPVFLEPTRWGKLRRIESERCDVFIDDLADFLREPTFPTATHRLLFAPGSPAGETAPGLLYARSWAEIDRLVRTLQPPARPNPPASARDRRAGTFTGDAATAFSGLVRRLLGVHLNGWSPLPGGINNLGAVLELDNGRTVVGKIYKRSAGDPRDRLARETAFLQLLERAGIDCVPRVLAVDDELGAALHTLVPGRRWPEDEPPPPALWSQFDRFFADLQRVAALPEAAQLPLAAEAALTLQEHLAWVQERRDRWLARARDGGLSVATTRLILDELESTYDALARRCIAHPDFQNPVDRRTLVLSPSDFGLHNALVTESGAVSFVDFEYAGWDDPAKADFDFAHQPRYAASRPERLACLDARFDRASERTALVRELLELKWRYIVLAATTDRPAAPQLLTTIR